MAKSSAEYMREWRQKNKERSKELANRWRRENREKTRGYHLKAKFGITNDDYDRMLEEQDFVCAICGEPSDKTYHVDHCHTSGKVRGLLCNTCNRGLGYFKDNTSFLTNAI